MMKEFIRISYDAFQHENLKATSKMIFLLSVIAQIIKETPRLRFPFTKKFVDKLFLIDREFLQNS